MCSDTISDNLHITCHHLEDGTHRLSEFHLGVSSCVTQISCGVTWPINCGTSERTTLVGSRISLTDSWETMPGFGNIAMTVECSEASNYPCLIHKLRSNLSWNGSLADCPRESGIYMVPIANKANSFLGFTRECNTQTKSCRLHVAFLRVNHNIPGAVQLQLSPDIMIIFAKVHWYYGCWGYLTCIYLSRYCCVCLFV